MKISKCKKELASVISENGGWRNGGFAAQDGDGLVGGYGSKPEWNSLSKYWWREALGGWFLVNKIKNHHQAVLSRAEYFHLYPAPGADGWIEWKGGECPVDVDALVCCRWRSGKVMIAAYRAGNLSWRHNGNAADIIAYRLHEPEQVETVEYNYPGVAYTGPVQSSPQFCESVMRSIPEPEAKPTIDQLLQDWRNADDFAQRKQAEADEAAAMRNERWKELQARAGEMGVTVVLCESVAAEPELVADSIAWDDLFEGDEMLCVIPFGGAVNEGSVGKVRYKAEGKITVDFPEQRDYVYYRSNFERGDVKFIRRP